MFLRRKAYLYCTVLLICLLPAVFTGCSAGVSSGESESPVARGETLVQISTIDALLNGVYDGVVDYDTLAGYGDFGIGTFAGLDGEMIGFDGEFYQVKADGVAYPVSGAMTTPFSCVTVFDTDREEKIPAGLSYTELQDYIDGILPTENIFYAIRIDGSFSYVKTRSVPGQERPYPPLVEVTANQAIFEFIDVEGTIVGFRCPPYVGGVNVVGYHLHFLTADKTAGGHLLECNVSDATLYVDDTPGFFMVLPDADSDFYDIDLSGDKQAELEKAEK